ncbi:condensin-2 complex subunit D3 [Canna indica]|uniref:Condensin-2 complex subunit D3 n=1 Tax=Canna indica TaxID=4628 RepID=A0AAQ3JUI7_9LILI|nr:condensin-2 complex subunit D3 [Canna indica]
MDAGDESETLSEILSELDASHRLHNEESPLSECSILGLQSFLDSASRDADTVSALWDLLTARGLPASALLRPLSAVMDSSTPHLPLLAARSYLSLLLSPGCPLYSLFTPPAFLSLLRSLRRSLKPLPSPSPASASATPSPDPSRVAPTRRKNVRKRKNSRLAGGVSTSSPVEQLSDVAVLLPHVLEQLDSVLCRVQLDSTTDAVKSLVETVTGILSSSSNHRVTDLCFRVLYRVVSKPEHGDQTTSAVEILRSLTPMLLCPVKSPCRTSAVLFVSKKLVSLGHENEKVRKAVVYLPRFLATKAPEKSEPRACAVDSIVEIVRVMEHEDQVGFTQYLVKMTQGKAQLRLLAVDLILAVLTSIPNPFGVKELSHDINGNAWGLSCLKALVLRCSDSAPTIRARALTNTAQVLGLLTGDSDSCSHLREFVGIGNVGFDELLKRRCQDDKAAVRKAALLLITKSIAIIERPLDQVLLRTLSAACSDPLVTIRKAAIVALSEACRRFPDGRVITEWLHSVPRLIVDNETSIQEDCENLFLELVLDRISQAVKVNFEKDTTDLESLFPEGLFGFLKGICDNEVAPCVKKICASLGKKKKIKMSVASSLQNLIATSESLWLSHSKRIERWTAPAGTWQLLSEVSLFTPKAIKWEFLQHHWHLLDKDSLEEQCKSSDDGREPNSFMWAGDRVHLLHTISNVSLELPPEPAAELACSLLDRIKKFNMDLSEVDAHVKALKILCKRKAARAEEGDALVVKWVNQLLSEALEILNNYVQEVSGFGKNNSFLTPPPTSRRKGKRDASQSKSTLKAATAAFTIGSVMLVCPSADLQGILPVLHTIITSGSSEPKPKKLADLKVSFSEVAPPLYIQSWVTMGKICLVDDKLAKRYIPLFVQELERSDNAALRNNIMVVMTDFCVRYTALVDCYIQKVTMSLRDPCEVVRRQTFILLSQLLQRDYVKWRGVLFLRFLLSLVDESEKIRHLADFLFGNILKAKAPLLAYNSFIEAIFFLNDCSTHSVHSESQKGSNTRSRLFCIRGTDVKSRSQRMHIYVSLLKQMAPEHLLATSAKLCAEILAAASDGLLNIDAAAGLSVLQDALEILACKEMRIHPSRASDSSELDDEGGDSAARGRVVTQVAKKNLIQIAIPIFIELKQLLESKNSPLTGCLMECLRVLLKDYKNEIDEILVADKQLQKELLYDMQKFEAANAQCTVAEAIANVQRSESYCSPKGQIPTGIYTRVTNKLGSGGKIASAVADAAARAKVRSVLKEVNQNSPTPPLHSMSVPKLKSSLGSRGAASNDRPVSVLESLRRRQSFESDEDE